jgi:hypothetical protein
MVSERSVGPCFDSVKKLYMDLVVLVKKMSVIINFLLQNTNIVSVLTKTFPNFTEYVWQDWRILRTLVSWSFYLVHFHKKNYTSNLKVAGNT